MKYNIQSLINDFFKLLKWWYLLLLIIFYGNFLYLNFSQKAFEITRIDFLSSLGIFYTLGEFTSINKLLFIFQLFLTVFTTISFYNYEINNSSEFIYLRQSKIKLLVQKFIIVIIFIMFIRTIYYFINYYFYKDYVIYFKDYILNIIIHLLVIVICTLFKYIRIAKSK